MRRATSSNRTSRRLHFVGTTLGLLWLAAALVTLNGWFLLAGLVCGYAFAWVAMTLPCASTDNPALCWARTGRAARERSLQCIANKDGCQCTAQAQVQPVLSG